MIKCMPNKYPISMHKNNSCSRFECHFGFKKLHSDLSRAFKCSTFLVATPSLILQSWQERKKRDDQLIVWFERITNTELVFMIGLKTLIVTCQCSLLLSNLVPDYF